MEFETKKLASEYLDPGLGFERKDLSLKDRRDFSEGLLSVFRYLK